MCIGQIMLNSMCITILSCHEMADDAEEHVQLVAGLPRNGQLHRMACSREQTGSSRDIAVRVLLSCMSL